MDILIGVIILIVGFVGIFRPNIFYKSELLTPQQIERNRRIWTRGGLALVVLGIVVLATQLF